MERCSYVLTEHERFIKEFIILYKENSVLWDAKHPHYRNRSERSEAYEILLKKCREYYQTADEDFVRMKIDSMRSSFRKEHRKVKQSREKATKNEDVYKPNLWYYDLLLFTAGEECEKKEEKTEEETADSSEVNLVRIPFWNREYSAIMIEFYKNHPCLYDATHPHLKTKRKRHEAIRKITQDLIAATGKYFQVEDVRRKIALLRGQFLFEYKKVRRNEARGVDYKPTLWCFEMLHFLKEQYSKPEIEEKKKDCKMNLRRSSRKRKNSTDESNDEEEEELWDFPKKDSDSSMSSDTYHLDKNDFKISPKRQKNSEDNDEGDIFDIIAKNVAHKLRDMNDEQRKIAQRLLNDLMYHGQMENLTTKSRLSLDGK